MLNIYKNLNIYSEVVMKNETGVDVPVASFTGNINEINKQFNISVNVTNALLIGLSPENEAVFDAMFHEFAAKAKDYLFHPETV